MSLNEKQNTQSHQFLATTVQPSLFAGQVKLPVLHLGYFWFPNQYHNVHTLKNK
jgi:Mlc titration factor MtfA (ptsG expression regulator)